jgi:hypothetical protein
MLTNANPSAQYPDSSRTEREAFFKRLWMEPSFLFRHARTLSGAVCRRARTKLVMSFSDAHQGRKVRPAWLDVAAFAAGPPVSPAERALVLPTYAVGAPLSRAGCSGREPDERNRSADDLEAYFAEQRWGFLTQALLAGEIDRERQLAVCVDWVQSHTDKANVAWEPYSACERVANLLVFLAATQTATGARGIPLPLRRFLQDSLTWILQHLEYYGPRETNNHILNNARAIVLASVALEDTAARAAGMQVFRQCLPGLIMEHGFLRERSTHYQVIVLNWLLDAWSFLRVAEDAEAERKFLGGYVESMIGATAVICSHDNGLVALIGDVSPDLTPVRSVERLRFLYADVSSVALQAASAALLTDGWFRIGSQKSVILGNFPTGLFPVGFPTHGHADLTSFVWTQGGKEILVDRGRYRYTADSVSAFQKRASGHNVPLVNGFAPLCESLIPEGHWWPLPYAAAQLEASVSGASVTMAHDGFARATPVRRHSRALTLEPDSLVVVDTFSGTGEVELAFCWHFGEGFDRFDAQRMMVFGGGACVALQVSGVAGALRATSVYGDDPDGWISRSYGEIQPALGICLRWQLQLPSQVVTRFSYV